MRPLLVAGLAAVALAGCGLDVQTPDLFQVTRTGGGKPLTMLVNYTGSIRCDGRAPRMLSDKALLAARVLPSQLQPDAKRKLDAPSPPGSVYRYKVRFQYGTIEFPDTAAAHRPEIAQFEQVMLQAEATCAAGG